jgi:hypothetical protein
MPSNDPTSPTAGPDDPADAIRRLQERLEQASVDAERLISEASAAREGTAAGKPPPAGWQSPNADRERPPLGGDLELLTQLLHSLRELVPSELERRLAEALRELLLAVRALIDFYLERLGKRGPEPTEVEDIPID